MKKKLVLLWLLLAPIAALAQGARIDPFPSFTTQGFFPGGSYPPLLLVPNSKVTVCGFPAVGFPCTNRATTYTDVTLAHACPTTSQIVLNGSSSCVSTSDIYGRFGFWVTPGNYTYTITNPHTNQTTGPYVVTAGGGGAPSGGVTQLIPGPNCTVSPTTGVGAVTFNCAGGGTVTFPADIPQTDTVGGTPRTAGALDVVGTGDGGAHKSWTSFQPTTITQTLVNTVFNEHSVGSAVIGTQPATDVAGTSWIGLAPAFPAAPTFATGGGMQWTSTNSQMLLDVGTYGGTATFSNVVVPTFGYNLVGLADGTGQNYVLFQVTGTTITTAQIINGIFTNIATFGITLTGTDTWQFVVGGQSLVEKLNGTTVGTVTLPAGTAITSDRFWGIQFGAPVAKMGGFSYTGTTTITQPIPAVGVNCILQGNANCGPVTANLAIAPRSDGFIGPVPEVGYSTNQDGTSSVAWNEDRNRGVFDVRRPRNGVTWASNPGQAWTNTMQDAICNQIQNHVIPTILLPAGQAGVTGLLAPPAVGILGTGAVSQAESNNPTVLQQTNPANVLMDLVNSYTTSCNGVTTTVTGNGASVKGIAFQGLGSSAPTDIGVQMDTLSGTVQYDSFFNFGGPGLRVNGQNNSGDHLLLEENLAWYFQSGAYNVSGFTDPNYHAAIELFSGDEQFHDIVQTGFSPDPFVAGQGYYNRWLLCGVLLGGSPAFPFTNSYIEVNPNNICTAPQGQGAFVITNNRIDLAWFHGVRLTTGPAPEASQVMNNTFVETCISPTLNPANFPNNPGGVSPDPNCAYVHVEQAQLSSRIGPNQYTLGPVAQYAVGNVWYETNVSGQTPGVVEEPGEILLGSQGGYPVDGNQNVDVSRSIFGETKSQINNAGGTIPMGPYRSIYLHSSVATSWTGISAQYPDTIRYIDIGPNDTITSGATIALCTSPITGDNTHRLHSFNYALGVFTEFACGSGGGGGGNVSNSGTPTSGQVAVWVTATTIQGLTPTGTGTPVFSNSPTLVTPALGTPSSGVLTNATGLPLTAGAGVTGILPGANGGTGNGFTAFTGPTTSLKTFTLPNSSATILTSANVVTVPQGGSGVATISGVIKGNGVSAFTAAGAADVVLLWSGTCNGTTFLRGDGSCAAPTGSGTVNSGTVNRIAIYASTGTAVSNDINLTDNGTLLAYTGSGGLQINGPIASGSTPPNCGSGVSGIVCLSEASTAGTPAAGVAYIRADSTSNTFKLSINGGAETTLGAGGNVNNSGTPTSGQMAVWVNATTIQGVSLGSGVQTFLTTPSSANFFAAITDETGSGVVVGSNSPTLVTPNIGAATGTSLLVTGNVDGTAPVTITTGTSATLGGTFRSGYTLNQEATAATAVAYTLPTAAAGRQYCVGNSWNGSAATTGVLTVNASASGQFIIFTDGTLSATGGNVTSGGAAADAACFVGVDSTHWQLYVQRGTWTKH